jgi:hypothetical protein
MQEVRFSAIVQPDGTIHLPARIKKYYSKRVDLILIDNKNKNVAQNAVHLLGKITREYNHIHENEIDIKSIFKNRNKAHERKILFN